MGAAERRAAQGRILAGAPVLGARIADALRREIPAYASLQESQRVETEAIARWGVQRLLELWVEDGRLDEHDLRRFYGIGVARGTDGRPLSAVLRAYRVAAVEASGLVRDSGVDDLDVDDVLAMNVVLLESLDALSESLSAGYAAASERLAEDRGEVVRTLVQDLLAGRQVSGAALEDRTRLLGLVLPQRLSMTVVGSGAGHDVTPGDVAQLVLAGAADGGDVDGARAAGASVDGDGADGRPLVLSTTRHGQGVVLHAGELDVGPGATVRGWRACRLDDVALADLPAAYRLAEVAVRHAPAEAAGRVLGEADALLVALLHGRPSVDPTLLAEAALRPVLEPGQAHLLEGITAYLAHGTAIDAARALGLHPQTMRYRLRRVRQVTGRDLASSWDRLLLGAATTVLTLRGPGR
jgi:hypothetical protein